jgi:hypothetical protein
VAAKVQVLITFLRFYLVSLLIHAAPDERLQVHHGARLE